MSRFTELGTPSSMPGSALETSTEVQDAQPRPRSKARPAVLIFFVLLVVTVALQAASGAYKSEFGSYPDEPAHYVTSLMVREYITSGTPAWPMQFAENYYAHYPKVAFGHWPPLFYGIQALWMMLFSASRVSVRLELAVTTAVLGFSVYLEAKRWLRSKWGAYFAGLLTVCLPLVQASTDEEMAEILLALTCFWSAVCFARYIQSERPRDAFWFAIFFSLAVLTKGSGWLLVFVPPIALVLANKVRLAFKASFWMAAGLIAICCLPWQIMTLRVAERGWTGGAGPSVSYTVNAIQQFGSIAVSIMGPLLAALTLLGVIATAGLPFIRFRRCDAIPAAMLALILADWIFHSVVPAGVENRKMIMAVPGLVLFLVAGAKWVAASVPAGRFSRFRFPAALAVITVIFAVQTFAIPRHTRFGYIEAAKFITSTPSLRGATILASSSNLGEGLLISEIAMREPRPTDTIIRATKALAKTDWTGTQYRCAFTSAPELVDYLNRSQIKVIVTDDFPPIANFEHSRLLAEALRDNPENFRLLRSFKSPSLPGSVQIFEKQPPAPF
ncbi:MAG: glycosyltransferase family 39 protein [Acidobacteriaceae bacterium]|nr:glycosyltransferase family 39 protein [Acidobacteriaceae bacterium]